MRKVNKNYYNLTNSKNCFFRKDKVPYDQHKDTPLYLFATAGMRLISESDQEKILSKNLKSQLLFFFKSNPFFNHFAFLQMR